MWNIFFPREASMSWKLGIGILLVLLAVHVANAKSISCRYEFMNVEVSTVRYDFDANGTVAGDVTVSAQGQGHTESFTSQAPGADEFLHGWISKENPKNAIEAIIYREPKSQGLSVLINHNVPVGQQIWAQCEEAAAR